MKILLITQHFYPDMVSTGLHMTELTSKWKELFPDVQISVFTAENSRKEYESDFKKFEIYKGVNVFRVKNSGKHHGNLLQRIIFSVVFILKAFIFLFKNKKNFDILLITTNPPFLGILILLLKKVLKLPYIIIAYDIYPQILEKMNILKSSSIIYKFWKWLNVRVYNNATNIVSIGRDMTKIIIDEMQIKDKSKIHIIHNWSDKETVYPVDKRSNNFIINNQLQDKKILLYSGTLGSTHNVEEILVAADELKQYPQIIFLFIGGGAKVELVKKYISNSNCSNVKYLPFQPIELISQTLSSASLSFVCLDSSFTGLSVPSKSYGILAAGVPIIGLMSSNSEISMMIEENNCGIVWNEEKGTKLSKTILEILKDEIKLEEMKLNAYDTFIKNYEISISVRKYNNLTISALG